jgi:hypothetical protein
MVSILGSWDYKFPAPILLTKTMKDYLEDEVDEKYYINSEKADQLIAKLIADGTILEQSRAEQSRAEQRLICPSTNQGESMSQTVSQPELTEVSATTDRKVAVSLKMYGTELSSVRNTACTLMARDYKGFGKQVTNGVIEWESDK